MNVNQIAEVCHQANKAICESQNDMSQADWSQSPEWQRQSAINGVNFHLTTESTPEQSHISWMKEKVATGWIYGPLKDVEARQHPCMMPYDLLPPDQKVKDHVFRAVVACLKQYLPE